MEKQTMYKGKMVGVVDCTPTWEGLLPLLLDNAENKNTAVSGPAKDELKRMAHIADKYKEIITKSDSMELDQLYKKWAEAGDKEDEATDDLSKREADTEASKYYWLMKRRFANPIAFDFFLVSKLHRTKD